MQVFKVTKNLVKERIGAVFSYEAEARAWCINNGVDYNRIEIVTLHASANDGSCILEYKSGANIDNPSSRYKRLCTLGWQCLDEKTKEWYLEEEVTPETTPEYLYFNEKGINIIRGSSHMFYYYNGIVYEHTPQARDYLLSLKAANGCNAVYKLEYFPPIETNSDYFLCTKIEEGASAFKCIKDSPPIPMNSDSETTPTVLAAIPQIKQTDVDGWYEVAWGSKCYRAMTYEYYPGFEPVFGLRYIKSDTTLVPLSPKTKLYIPPKQ